MIDFLTQPFVLGLLLGLAAAAYVALAGWSRRRALATELKTLQGHLHTQLTINAQGNQATQQELAALKQQNENLRISLATLQAKPDKAELRLLHVYDRAIRLMSEKAPGFAPSWESILREAEAEIAQADTGLTAWVRKSFRPLLGSTPAKRIAPPDED
jgi:hypothetical protein